MQRKAQRITFIQCSTTDVSMVCVVWDRDAEERERDDQHDYEMYVADAAKACRCSDLWAPCEGVLAGGVCDELYDDEQDDYDDDRWECE